MSRRTLIQDMRHLAGISNLYEAKDVEDAIRDKLREIVANAKNRWKAKKPEDLSDELEELLKKANLAKPPVLSKKQYDAVAGVWEILSGDDLSQIVSAASRALMQMSESDKTPRKPVLGSSKR